MLNVEELRDYCLAKPVVTEGLPFGEDTLVFKVAGKIFLLIGLEKGDRFNVKCDPELAIELRERHPEVQPGYHMNKKLWNTVAMDGTLTRKQLLEMIDHSYAEVVKSLPKKRKPKLAALLNKCYLNRRNLIRYFHEEIYIGTVGLPCFWYGPGTVNAL
ncbi:MmcQ/YjbR family DNA-binding protein [Mucilaginibacter antarcticus]|uniref:MmcQ/YjbR family DNA-binding protein n=1 Tax=Mucilaginibacter antarcticus TaxID=1855725 RepID=UPI0036443A8B